MAEPQNDSTQPETSERTRKLWRIAAVVSVLFAALSAGALASLLFGVGPGGRSTPAGDVIACVPTHDFTKQAKNVVKCPPKGTAFTDGLVEKSNGGTFTMQRIESGKLGKRIKLHVRKPDQPYIDIAHAQTHAALGQPVRVYTKKYHGEEVVVYMVDSPLIK